MDQPKVEIESFECLSENILVDKELIFKVGVNCDKTRTILYKFVKINSNGRATCIQDYSTNNIISYTEGTKENISLCAM